jgi:hypothetical protein
MGFMFKSAFWLGVVYYAMPLGELPLPSAETIVCAAANAPLSDHAEALHGAAAAGCAASMVSKEKEVFSPGTRDATPGPRPALRSSTHSLIGADRHAPWIGPSSAERAKQS